MILPLRNLYKTIKADGRKKGTLRRLFEHGEDLKAYLAKVVAPVAVVVDLAGLVHANDVGQVRGQCVQ
eukprot:6176980-Pleurochrysis_carterae.AAC.1